jgi:hypothetical protein
MLRDIERTTPALRAFPSLAKEGITFGSLRFGCGVVAVSFFVAVFPLGFRDEALALQHGAFRTIGKECIFQRTYSTRGANMSSRRRLPSFLIYFLIYFLIGAAVCLPMTASSQARRPTLWFEGARLIVGDKTPTIESSAFLVEGDSFTWVGKKGERQPPANATRVDLTGKTVIPALIDGHNHIGLVNEKDGTNQKTNYTRDNLIDQLQRYAYYGTAAAMSMGLEADRVGVQASRRGHPERCGKF